MTGFIIGIDTGGTYTDAAIIDQTQKRILATAKSITTKGDFSIGVGDAMARVLEASAAQVKPKDVAMVSISTTLATNAVVEGHGGPVAAVLIGFDDGMVERTGIAKAFPGIPILRIAGGHDHSGGEVQKLDVEFLKSEVARVAKDVGAFSVASAFATRNNRHEMSAREIITALTGKPATISTELSSALDAPRRALTAVLNARLISRIQMLITAVAKSMASLGISCPMMIVRGDGSLALAASVAERPIETVLSGPAASLIGAKWLTNLNDFIMSDIGGTTTDIGVLIGGHPQVAEQGAEVGGWRTMVKAIDVKTIGLGGDSEVHVGLNGFISIGPQRAVPVSLIGHRYPEVIDMLQGDLADTEGGSLHGKFVLLPFGAVAQSSEGLSEHEREILNAVRDRPTPMRRIAVSSAAQRAVVSLRKKGLIQFSALTPSDVSHVLDLQHNWSKPAATLATKLSTRFRDMKDPTDERTKEFAQAVWSKTVSLSCRAVLDMILPQRTGDSALIDAVCDGFSEQGLTKVTLSPRLPVVAVGGPAKVYYAELAKRLECEIVFAENSDVANAVGAAAGVVSHSVVITVEADGKGLFLVQGEGASRQFTSGAIALTEAVNLAERSAKARAIEFGAFQPNVSTVIKKHHLPEAKDDEGLLSAVVTSQASGHAAQSVKS